MSTITSPLRISGQTLAAREAELSNELNSIENSDAWDTPAVRAQRETLHGNLNIVRRHQREALAAALAQAGVLLSSKAPPRASVLGADLLDALTDIVGAKKATELVGRYGGRT